MLQKKKPSALQVHIIYLEWFQNCLITEVWLYSSTNITGHDEFFGLLNSGLRMVRQEKVWKYQPTGRRLVTEREIHLGGSGGMPLENFEKLR